MKKRESGELETDGNVSRLSALNRRDFGKLSFGMLGAILPEARWIRANAIRTSKRASSIQVTESSSEINISTSAIEAAVRKQGYVSGVYGGSFIDKRTGFRDLGFGLDVVDWLMAPGSDKAYRSKLNPELVYHVHNLYGGDIPKRIIEGPQICTQARHVSPEVIRGGDFVAIRTRFKYYLAAPGYKPGAVWTQTIIFPENKRYFISSDRIDTVNSCDCMFLRIDMPGHIKHRHGDTFSEVYLSYYGRIPSSAFLHDFPPNQKYLYDRAGGKIPRRFIRAYHIRDPKTGREGPWLAGMTLDPGVVYEAWCHERGYVCMIEEIGGWAVRPGESFSGAYVVGFFDSIEQMNEVYDHYAGNDGVEVNETGWKLIGPVRPSGVTTDGK